jgi:hypothetical protein
MKMMRIMEKKNIKIMSIFKILIPKNLLLGVMGIKGNVG